MRAPPRPAHGWKAEVETRRSHPRTPAELQATHCITSSYVAKLGSPGRGKGTRALIYCYASTLYLLLGQHLATTQRGLPGGRGERGRILHA